MNGDMIMHLKNSAAPFKAIFGVLKDLLSDVNLHFQNNQVELVGVDPEKVSIVEMTLMVMQEYFSTEDLYVGVDIPSLYKLFRGATPDHIVTMTIWAQNPEILEISIEDQVKNTKTFATIKSAMIPVEYVRIPSIEPDAVATLSTSQLYKTIREISHVSKRVAIGCCGDVITFLASGDQGVVSVAAGPSDGHLHWYKAPEKGIHANYYVRFIEKFCKPSLSSTVDIYFKRGHPLTFQCSDPGHMGVVQLSVAAIPDQTLL